MIINNLTVDIGNGNILSVSLTDTYEEVLKKLRNMSDIIINNIKMSLLPDGFSWYPEIGSINNIEMSIIKRKASITTRAIEFMFSYEDMSVIDLNIDDIDLDNSKITIDNVETSLKDTVVNWSILTSFGNLTLDFDNAQVVNKVRPAKFKISIYVKEDLK